MKTLTRTSYTQGIPVYGHDKGMQLAQGGFNLDTTGLTPGAIIPAGSALGYNEATRVATLLKTAKVAENAASNAVNYKVAKGHVFSVGKFLTKGGASKDITAIDKSNANYDTITVSATLGAASAGDALYEATGDAASNPTVAVTVKGLLWKDTVVDDYPLVDIVIRHANVYARRIPALPASIRATLPNLIFSESF